MIRGQRYTFFPHLLGIHVSGHLLWFTESSQYQGCRWLSSSVHLPGRHAYFISLFIATLA
jgi:hypothetical protein